jgi:hypothetical protein
MMLKYHDRAGLTDGQDVPGGGNQSMLPSLRAPGSHQAGEVPPILPIGNEAEDAECSHSIAV